MKRAFIVSCALMALLLIAGCARQQTPQQAPSKEAEMPPQQEQPDVTQDIDVYESEDVNLDEFDDLTEGFDSL